MAKAKNNDLTNGQFGKEIITFKQLIEGVEKGEIPETITRNQHPLVKNELLLTGTFTVKRDKTGLTLDLKLDQSIEFANSKMKRYVINEYKDWPQMFIPMNICRIHEDTAEILANHEELTLYKGNYFSIKTSRVYCDLAQYYDEDIKKTVMSGIICYNTMAEKAVMYKKQKSEDRRAEIETSFTSLVNQYIKK
jgi:hypothetical protein